MNVLLLYISHLLSAWNSRAFEFGAFLFLATIYPQTLLPASIYALARAGSAATISPWIGRYIDRAERLRAVRLSIVGQRVAVAISCAVLLAMVQFERLKSSAPASYALLAVLSILACVEKLSAVMNTISVSNTANYNIVLNNIKLDGYEQVTIEPAALLDWEGSPVVGPDEEGDDVADDPLIYIKIVTRQTVLFILILFS